MITCEIIVSEILCEDINYKVYGFSFYKNGESKPFRIIKDVCVEYEKALYFMEIINNSDICECSIDEIIEDILV